MNKQKIIIRHPTIDDQDNFISTVAKSHELHYPWVNPPQDRKAFSDYLTKYSAERDISYLVIMNGEIAGVINLNEICRGAFQNAFLGFYGMQNYIGKGVMSEGLKLVLEAAFETHQLHRLEANIQPDNHASIRLVKQNGFRKEGFSPRYLKILDEWKDHERWAITLEDWTKDL